MAAIDKSRRRGGGKAKSKSDDDVKKRYREATVEILSPWSYPLVLVPFLVVLLAVVAGGYDHVVCSSADNKENDIHTQQQQKSNCHPKRQHLCTPDELRAASLAHEHFARGNRLAATAASSSTPNNQMLEEAKEAFESSIQIDSTSAFASSAYQNLGLILSMLGVSNGESRKALRTAVRLDEESIHAHLGLANSLSQTHEADDWHEADGHYVKALDLLLAEMGEGGDQNSHYGLMVPILTSHGMALRRIANRDPDIVMDTDSSKDYLERAKNTFERAVNLAKSGKVPPPSVVNAIIYLQELLRPNNSSREELLEWAVNRADVWKDKRQLPQVFNRHLYDVMEPKPIRPYINDPAGRIPVLKRAAEQWETILSEYRSMVSTGNAVVPVGERVDLDRELYNRHLGEDWSEIPLLSGEGKEYVPSDVAPTVTSLFRGLVPPRGSVSFSSITPGTRIKPHYGPTNEMITCHLGLIIPQHGSVDVLGIMAGGEKRGWKEGEWMCFEDSMEHAVWNDSGGMRVVLIAQLKHPLLG